ncbi:VPS9 domain-containing protein 1-like [Patiria miniata]|uniref:VPS9 domain-containing protein n=1 Tax=Patiria miniata TaxID=46514 RepID=A0A914B3J4_PATMI|nr:VPS9 domain-containing protein 1-like [Patiria miniata]XP_038070374.1 VPS9 domain-containing protein 1-like [Patiria miniata]
MEGSLHTAMKAVGQAIQLDGAGDNKEAYYRYLACIQYISQTVLEDSKSQGYQGPIKTKGTAKMLKLAQQCMDRVTAIMENTEEGDASHLTPPPGDQSGRFSPSIRSFTSSPVPSEQPTKAYEPLPTIGTAPKPTELPSAGACQVVTPTASLPVPVGYTRPQTARKDKLTPLEAAYLENRRLINSYKARLVQLMETNKGKGQLNKTTMNLTLQRRLMENMAIARAREAALAKKIQERHQRLQEEAARRFSTTGEPTRAEIELRQMYASVMEFESNESWLLEWRHKLQKSPRDLQFIHALIGHILACPAHPFTQLLKKFQFTVYQTLLPLVQKDTDTLEQIKVPYKTVEPLKLAGSERKVIPPNGFANPGDLMDKSLDEDLMRRLHALRNSSDDEKRESLYGDMLASSSSLNEDEEDDLWDELNDGDNTLEDGIGAELEDAREGGGIASNLDNASIKSKVSVEVELCDDRDDSQVSHHSDGNGNNDEENLGDATVSNQEHSVDECGDQGKGGENGVSQEEEEARILAAEIEEELGDDDGEDVVRQMKRISAEVKEDLQEALAEGEELRMELEKQIAQDTAQGAIPQNGEDSTEETADKSQDDLDRNSDDGEVDQISLTPSCEGEKVSGGEPEEAESNGNRSDSETSPKQRTLDDSEQTDDRSQGGEKERQEVREAKQMSKEEEEQQRIAKLQEDALQRHLKHISKDIQSYLDRLQSLLVAIYEELDSAVAKEQCIAVIEKHFFHLIWQPLLTLFRRANLHREISAATAMTKYQHARPENIGIIKKLCLDDESDRYPYQLAVEELRRISGYFSPLEKLECVVKASRAIVTCVGDYYEAQGRSRENTENAVGCDDLLPILSYVVIKSALPHIVSECSIMEEFIHEGYLFGEEGYCLTTLQTSLGYVLKLAED